MSCGERLATKLRERGFRVTPQRAVILETVAHLQGHPTVKEVYRESRERLPGLNLATVYRALETMNEAGLVDLFNVGTDSYRFALRDADHPHGHLVCQVCGEVEEFKPQLINQLANRLREKHAFDLDAHHITLSGRCHRCQKRDASGMDTGHT